MRNHNIAEYQKPCIVSVLSGLSEKMPWTHFTDIHVNTRADILLRMLTVTLTSSS